MYGREKATGMRSSGGKMSGGCKYYELMGR